MPAVNVCNVFLVSVISISTIRVYGTEMQNMVHLSDVNIRNLLTVAIPFIVIREFTMS